MIHGRARLRVRVGAKRLCNQSADKEVARFAIFAERDAIITFVVRENRKDARLQMFQGLNASHIADKVLALVALNRLPLFMRKVWNHVHRFFSFTKKLGSIFMEPLSHMFEKCDR